MEQSSQPDRSNINVVVIGQQGSGKSTITGQLLYTSGAVDKRLVDRCEREAAEKNKKNCKYSWLSDKLSTERERGHSIEATTWRLDTNNHCITLIDAPGGKAYLRALIGGAAQADAAIIVLDASPAAPGAAAAPFEAGVAKDGQTREHAFIAFTFGLKQVVVAVNKLDLHDGAAAQKQRFEDVRAEAARVLKRQGIPQAQFVPLAALSGDNVAEGGPTFPWHSGPTLLQALDALAPVARPAAGRLRLPVQDVHRIGGIGTVVTGVVEAGTLRQGARVRFNPGGREAEVVSIERHHEVVEVALPGDNVGMHVKGVPATELRRGVVVSEAAEAGPLEVVAFTAELAIIGEQPKEITEGYCPVVACHTAHVPCRFSRLEAKLDKRTKTVLEAGPQCLRTGDHAVVRLVPQRPMVVEAYPECAPLGRFAVHDMGSIVAFGSIKSVERAPAAGGGGGGGSGAAAGAGRS